VKERDSGGDNGGLTGYAICQQQGNLQGIDFLCVKARRRAMGDRDLDGIDGTKGYDFTLNGN
jgi:hypothetical protein